MSENVNNIQWFPGHMAKTRRTIKENLRNVDIVAEICDARIPVSSRNPEIMGLVGDKPHIILLSKSDMADETATKQWISALSGGNKTALVIDCKSGRGLNRFAPAVREILSEKLLRLKNKGMQGRPVRAMVVGIPNVGKSTFINKLSKNSKAKVENRPGVTRNNQWFTVDKELELLDTPGVLWPKFEDKEVGEKLAITGAIKDTILDTEDLACRLIARLILNDNYKAMLKDRYKLEDIFSLPPYDILKCIALSRSMLLRGGDPDTERAANALLEEFRSVKIGRITLELP